MRAKFVNETLNSFDQKKDSLSSLGVGIKNKIIDIYKEKGLNAVYNFLKKNKVKYKQEIIEFGLETNSKACDEYIR